MNVGFDETSRTQRPSIGLLALSAIADDPRVRRQGDAFAAAGWTVRAFGLAGALSPPPAWPATGAVSPRPAARTFGARVGRAARIAAVRAGLLPAEAFLLSRNPALERIRSDASAFRADLWLANDWTMLPIAARLARDQGALYAYDSHELATDENSQSRKWRLLERPLVRAVEGRRIRGAAAISCVSDGIADRLRDLYRLPVRPEVIRNAPPFEQTSFRPTGDRVRVLYHGLVSPGRGLENCVRAVALWRPEFDLTIRGPSSETYLSSLRAVAESVGVADRIRFVPPVPMTALVAEASAFDVGLFALPGDSRHNRHALPNKFFEYVMAGLALCVSDLPEMAHLVKRHDLGALFADTAPSAIAAAVNGLDRPSIDRYKRQALAAARELCWEREGDRLVERCAETLDAERARR